MARAQNSAKGRFQKQIIQLPASGAIWADDFSEAAIISVNSSGIKLGGSVKINDYQLLTGDSTGITYGTTLDAIPGNVTSGALVGWILDSTGFAGFIGVTGTTHKYIATTTKRPE